MENLSFEESLEKLEEIVNRLEKGDVPLDDAIDEFNKAMDAYNWNEVLGEPEDYIKKETK